MTKSLENVPNLSEPCAIMQTCGGNRVQMPEVANNLITVHY